MFLHVTMVYMYMCGYMVSCYMCVLYGSTLEFKESQHAHIVQTLIFET